MAILDLETIGGYTIEVGDSRDMRISFRDRNGGLVDPSSVTITVNKPDGVNVSTYNLGNLTKVRDGVYTLTLTFDQAGPWVGKVVPFGFDIQQFRITVGEDI